MFDQLKVNQNSLVNLLKSPEKDNSDILSKKPENDFLSMVMEKSGYDNKTYKIDNKSDQNAESRKSNEKSEPAKTEHNNKTENTPELNKNSDNNKISTENDRDNSGKTVNHSGTKNDINPGHELKLVTNYKEIKPKSEISGKDIKSEKIQVKKTEEDNSFINQLLSAGNVRNLIEIIKAVTSGNKKSEEESFQKFFSSLKPGSSRESGKAISPFRKTEADKNHKLPSDFLALIKKDIKESISGELSKYSDKRKPDSKIHTLNDKELKELASSIIDHIKKNRSKDAVKHEARINVNEETKLEKKPVIVHEEHQLKKTITSDDSSFEKNGAKDKNTGRDNFSYNGTKIDFSGKSGLDRFEHNLKNIDFKENLQEIIDKAKVTVRDSRNGTFTVRLNPQELGNVNVNLVMENGVITGKFLVDNDDVKNLLLSSLNDLKYQFEEAGIAVGEFSVNVNDQREKYLNQKDEESLKSLSFMKTEKEVIAAADQYNSSAAAHTGHINMVI